MGNTVDKLSEKEHKLLKHIREQCDGIFVAQEKIRKSLRELEDLFDDRYVDYLKHR